MLDSLDQVNWNMVGAIISFTLVMLTACQLLANSRTNRTTLQLGLLLRLDQNWNSDRMLATRRRAAAAMTHQRIDHDIGQILDFFQGIAQFEQMGALDLNLINDDYGYWWRRYVKAAEYYIDHCTKNNPMMWRKLREVNRRLESLDAQEREKHKRHNPPAQTTKNNAWDKSEIDDFLAEESQLPCS